MAENRGTAAPVAGAPLDELMLAMDVVDTLRHHEEVALRELEQDGRDEALRERLRRLYESQGLEVSDRILDEGIKALREKRFVYEPTPAGLPRMLAGLWIKRAAIGKGLLAVALVAGLWLGWSSWRAASERKEAEAARIELAETLPRQVAAAGEAALAEARTEAARLQVDRLQADALSALSRGDAEAARAAVAGLERLRQELVRTYDLRIVSRPGEDSGVFRIPDVNTGARNYYLIVEAVTPAGDVLRLPVRNEENGRIEAVTLWGVRVPQATFESVRRDKTDDGILQDDILASKPRGALEPVYRMNVAGGAITQW